MRKYLERIVMESKFYVKMSRHCPVPIKHLVNYTHYSCTLFRDYVKIIRNYGKAVRKGHSTDLLPSRLYTLKM